MGRIEKRDYWVVIIPADDAQLAAVMRNVRGAEVLCAEDRLWLRGQIRDPAQDLAKLLPGVRPYTLGNGGQLTRVGDRIPSEQLPPGEWHRLSEWLQLELPSFTQPFAGSSYPLSISLVRSGEEEESNLLLVSLAEWSEYGSTAPEWRLGRLVFALDSTQRVLIRGSPLPPILGQRWVERDGVATRAGWKWIPAIDAAVLRQSARVERDDLLLLDESHCEVVSASDWVRATRPAIRASSGAIHE